MSQRRHPKQPPESGKSPLDAPIGPGDWVATGANVEPHYRVIAVCGDKVWLRDVRGGHDGITSVSRCHKVDGPFDSAPGGLAP